jgi:hypothetical protein
VCTFLAPYFWLRNLAAPCRAFHWAVLKPMFSVRWKTRLCTHSKKSLAGKGHVSAAGRRTVLLCPSTVRRRAEGRRCIPRRRWLRFEEFGPECVVALDMINTGQYEQRFGSYWLAKLPDVSSDCSLDVGCDVGRSQGGGPRTPIQSPSDSPAKPPRRRACRTASSSSLGARAISIGATALT